MSTAIAEKIGKLLVQAERASTEAEAEVFMNKAQQLSTLYSVDMAKARHGATVKERTTPISRKITVGEAGTKGLNTYCELVMAIGRANDLMFNISHKSTYVIAFGFEEDIDATEALYASLLVQMVAASEQFKKAGEWKKDTVYRGGRYEYYNTETGKKVSSRAYYNARYNDDTIAERYVPGSYQPVSWLSARLDFQQSFASRIGVRLSQARAEALKSAQEAEERDAFFDAMEQEFVPQSSNKELVSTSLVLIEKTEAVADFYQKTSRARGTWGGGRSNTVSGRAASGGWEAGGSARLSAQSAIGGGRKSLR